MIEHGHRSSERVIAIQTADDAYEAAGVVLDAIIGDGCIDDDLSDSVTLCPTDIVRRQDGSIASVVCSIRDDGKTSETESTERILVGA